MQAKVTVAAVQMVSTPDASTNLDCAARLIERAAGEGAELVALPEYFCLMGRQERDKVELAETPGDGPVQHRLATLAQRHGVCLIAGTLPLRIEGDADHVYNSCLAFDPQGRQVARYDKIHLFRFDDGTQRYDEGISLCAGRQPVAFDAHLRHGSVLRVGLSICYDLRFPELYRALMTPPCDLLVVPAAFTHATGEAHWDLLLRTRAVENQCHVLASAQGGLHDNGRRTWGHSLLCDPWGRRVAQWPEGEGLALGSLDLDQARQIRTQLPALQHRVL
jgi:deaminated glutathione amidase